MELSKSSLLRLFASIVIDGVGMLSMFFGVTESLDVVYAPLSAILIYLLYGEALPAVLGFFEEILPFTDWIPSATLAWLYVYVFKRKGEAKK